MTPVDVDWIVYCLAPRRQALAAYAPVYWHPASDADLRHREFLAFLLDDGDALGVRTNDSFMLAQRRGDGWMVDDAVVAGDDWESEGALLWEALCGALTGPVRWVCPVPERSRREFAERCGFEVGESWWHREVIGYVVPSPSDAGSDVINLVGASARLVSAPPIYSPGGPILFLTDVRDPETVLGEALDGAPGLGSPVVVVAQPAHDLALARQLLTHDFTRHCDFLDGLV